MSEVWFPDKTLVWKRGTVVDSDDKTITVKRQFVLSDEFNTDKGDHILTIPFVDPFARKEIKDFEWKQYNPRKEINRYGLSVTSSDGTRNGIDLDSLYEYNRENNTKFDEDSFKTFTDVYYKSEEVQKLVEPFKPWLWRTHFLNFRKGGYFPPHRDKRTSKEQKSMRLLVPIS